MCDPISIAAVSTAAALGGTMIQNNEARSNQAAAINAKNAATARTIAAEKQLQNQSSGIFDQNLKPYQDAAPAQQLQTAQTADTSALAANAPTEGALAAGATTGNAPKVVQDAENNTIAARMKDLAGKNQALGALTGYDTAFQDNARNISTAKSKIGTIGDFARQTAMVGDAQMNADVANSQSPPSPWGDLLQGAGGLGLQYAGGKGAFSNLFGAKTKPTPYVSGNAEYY